MKNLLVALALCLGTSQAFAMKCLTGRSTTVDATGTIVAGSKEKCTVNAKNGSGGDLAKGSVVVLSTSSDDGFTVTTSTTAYAEPFCVYAEACENGKVCECQVSGYVDFLLWDVQGAPASAGHRIYISEARAGYARAMPQADVNANDRPLGIFLDNETDSTAEVEAVLKL